MPTNSKYYCIWENRALEQVYIGLIYKNYTKTDTQKQKLIPTPLRDWLSWMILCCPPDVFVLQLLGSRLQCLFIPSSYTIKMKV